jgi:hypothetical protein
VEAVVPTGDGAGVSVVGRDLCCVLVHPDRYGRRAVAAVLERAPAAAVLGVPASGTPELAAV